MTTKPVLGSKLTLGTLLRDFLKEPLVSLIKEDSLGKSLAIH